MPSTRLYLKNLPSYAKRDDVFNYLERFGRLTELKIIETDSLIYGFAQFVEEEDAKYVLETFRGRLFLGHRTVIEPARPLRKDMPSVESHSSRSSDSRTEHSSRYGIQPKYYTNRAHQCRYPVLVENIPRHICWQELKDFGRLSGGFVVYCDLDRSKNGRGFIEYLYREDAEGAIKTLDGQKLGGRAVSVSAHSRPAPRRPSRSRSPTRRPSSRVPDVPLSTSDVPRIRCAFPTSASRYSLQKSPERLPSPDKFSSTLSLYSGERTLPVLHPDLHTFSKAVDAYRTGLFGEIIAQGSRLGLQASTYIDSSEPVKQPAAETVQSNEYYNFDPYLRVSYDRSRLEYLPGCFT
ncbi:hypothetical protein C8R44DRAFT_88817 [Mycena epipterygia]|nr:hypothetical protein C8R44DRAFT_88817 [Mycena epipterygia]